MSYAVRNDLRGFRAVLDSSELLEDEFFSETLPDDPVPSTDEIKSIALQERDGLLTIASLRIGPLKDAEEDGIATEEELEKLKLWKDYRISLNRIEGQEGFPNNISWPKSPED